MESTNPRARIEAGWAPPPAIEAEPVLEPSDEFSPDDAAAFDATLGSLVEQFASLPPASYGEPPATTSEAPAPPPSGRWGVPLAAFGSMVLGGAITLAILIGPQQLWSRLSGAEASPTTVGATAAPSVEVKWTTPAPKAVPLAPRKVAASAKKAEVVAVVAAPVKPAAPRSTTLAPKTKRVKKASAKKAKVRKAGKGIKSVAGVEPRAKKAKKAKKAVAKKSPKAASAWKDPYE